MRPIYLDYNATTPVDPRVAEEIREVLASDHGNPSSAHSHGLAARAIIERGRARVAAALGASPGEIVLTGSGSEANNLAIKGAALANRARGNHIVTSAVEHPAVGEVCAALAGLGFETTVVPVDSRGRTDPADVEAAITDRTVLVSIMLAQNEVGTLQPVREIARIARRRGVLVHTDAAQAVGKIPVAVDDLGVDLLSIAGHKLYAPIGVGALYVREGVEVAKQIHGGGHERGRRAGTESPVMAAALGRAMELAAAELPARMEHMRTLRDRLHTGLESRAGGVALNGHETERLPNTLSVRFRGVTGYDLLAGVPGLAASSGSACHSGGIHVSATLTAMGLDPEEAVGTVRFSTGMNLTAEEVDRAVDLIASAAAKLRR